MIYQTRRLRNGFALMVEDVGTADLYLVSPVDTSLTLPQEYTVFVTGKAAAINRAEMLLISYEQANPWASRSSYWEYVLPVYLVEPPIWQSPTYTEADGDKVTWLVCKDPTAAQPRPGAYTYVVLVSVNGYRSFFLGSFKSLRKAIDEALLLYQLNRGMSGDMGDDFSFF